MESNKKIFLILFLIFSTGTLLMEKFMLLGILILLFGFHVVYLLYVKE